MSITVNVTIPENILNRQQDEIARRVLEEVVLEGYKSGQLTLAQVRRILGFETRMQLDAFLKAHGIFTEYSEADLEAEEEASRYIMSRRAK